MFVKRMMFSADIVAVEIEIELEEEPMEKGSMA
jgi:hypothetical protein